MAQLKGAKQGLQGQVPVWGSTGDGTTDTTEGLLVYFLDDGPTNRAGGEKRIADAWSKRGGGAKSECPNPNKVFQGISIRNFIQGVGRKINTLRLATPDQDSA